MNTETETRLRALRLDDSFLKLTPEEEAFLKSETGIQDTDELKKACYQSSGGCLQGTLLFE